MRIRMQPSRRGGFTLIELLVVVSILALLIGLTMAGISRVRAGQHARTTETTVKKLQVAFNQQVVATFDQANDEKHPYFPFALQYCDGDKDRAKSLLAYAYVKRDFPQTFKDATTTYNFGTFVVQPHKAFAKIPTAPSGLTADQESAVLLYIIINDMAKRGTSIDADGSLASSEMVIGNYKAYKDGYGSHIAFRRWYGPFDGADAAELQSAPYVNPKDNLQYGSFDPFDRLGKLKVWPNNGGKQAAAVGVLNSPAGSPPVAFDGLNKVIAVLSSGPDKKFGPAFGGAVGDEQDNFQGYRLARIGNTGN